MTQEDRLVKYDRMRYTKDSLSSSLVLLAIVLDALYFVSIYQSDVGSYYYTWAIGASILYNLVFLLVAFLCSEGVKNRTKGYTVPLLAIGAMQFVRIFWLPAKALDAVVEKAGEQLAAMTAQQHSYVVACLAISGALCIAAAVISGINNATLARYMRSLNEKTA